jgi:hypothetical protein
VVDDFVFDIAPFPCPYPLIDGLRQRRGSSMFDFIKILAMVCLGLAGEGVYVSIPKVSGIMSFEWQLCGQLPL